MLIDELLDIEKNDELYKFVFTYEDVLIWPFAKLFVYQKIYDKQYSLQNPHVEACFTKKEKINYLLEIIKNKLSFKKENYDIVFLNSSVGCFKKDDKYFNRLVDYFATEYKDKTLLVEHSHNKKIFIPRSFKTIFYHDYLKIKIHFFKYFHKEKTDNRQIDEFILFLKKYYSNYLNESDWEELKKLLISFESRLKSTHKIYDSFFKKIKPKILLVEDASYGQMNSYIIRIAKENNIYVAEYQHGLISSTHPGYNFITKNVNKNYLKTLPDIFLSFGDFWKEQVRMPYPIVNIGYPHLIEEAKKLENLKRTSKTILIASSGTDYHFINDFINDFIERETNYKIILRPHPSEKPEINQRYNDLINKGVHIDICNNIYDTFKKVDYFITDYSTIIYESTAFNLPVILFDNAMSRAYATDTLFSVCATAQEAIAMIDSNNVLKVDPNFIWEKNWKKNYKKFIESVL